MYLMTIELGLNANTNLATVRRTSNLATQQDGASDATCLTCSQLNLTRHAPCGTDERPERRAAKLNATTDGKLQPLRHASVDARDKRGHVSSELLLAFGGWTLDEHTAMRVLPHRVGADG